MAGTKLICPHCNAILKSAKAQPAGKRITCVKCKEPFTVAPEMVSQSTGDTQDGTSFALAETHAGVTKSPIAGMTFPDLSDDAEAVAEAPTKKSSRSAMNSEPTPLIPKRTARRGHKGKVLACLALVFALLLAGGGAGLAYFLAKQEPTDGKQPAENESSLKKVLAAVVPADPPKKADSSPKKVVPAAVADPKKKIILASGVDDPKKSMVSVGGEAMELKISAKQKKLIVEATQKGVAYLKEKIKPSGTWSEDDSFNPVGKAALPALAMMECGVSAKDPVIQQAAVYVRSHTADLVDTYDLGCTLLFLDRLGEPEDKKLIQNLALRLIAGQTLSGGWTYDKNPILSDDENAKLIEFLNKNKPDVKLLVPLPTHTVAAGEDPAPSDKLTPSRDREPAAKDKDPGVRTRDAEPGADKDKPLPVPPEKDKTKTPDKKALPALGKESPPDAKKELPPLAEKKKSPEKKSAPAKAKPESEALPLRVRELPIVAKQLKKLKYEPGSRDDNSNTHFALLGLWAARRHGVPVELTLALSAERYQKTQANDGGWGYVVNSPPKNTMTCVGLVGLAMGHASAADIFAEAALKAKAPTKSLAKDPAIGDAIKALGLYIDGHKELRGLEARIDLYYLWSLERVGMLYRQEKFGKKEWFPYGVKQILDRQHPEGNWKEHYDAPVDTAFALLFLNRSNLVEDLTARLHNYIEIPNATRSRLEDLELRRHGDTETPASRERNDKTDPERSRK